MPHLLFPSVSPLRAGAPNLLAGALVQAYELAVAQLQLAAVVKLKDDGVANQLHLVGLQLLQGRYAEAQPPANRGCIKQDGLAKGLKGCLRAIEGPLHTTSKKQARLSAPLPLRPQGSHIEQAPPTHWGCWCLLYCCVAWHTLSASSGPLTRSAI